MSESLQQVFEPPHDIYATKELPEDLFLKWWGLLAEEDRAEFTVLYGGDQILARFVCVIDYLVMQKVGGAEGDLFALAYYIAAKPFPEHAVAMTNPSIRVRASRAWKHDAVQALIDRVRYRTDRRRVMRIENLLGRNIEQMLNDAHETVEVVDPKTNEIVNEPKYDMKDRQFAAMAAVKYMALVKQNELEQAAQRTKLGLEKARKSLNREMEEPDPKALEAYMKLGIATFGEEKVKALLGLTD